MTTIVLESTWSGLSGSTQAPVGLRRGWDGICGAESRRSRRNQAASLTLQSCLDVRTPASSGSPPRSQAPVQASGCLLFLSLTLVIMMTVTSSSAAPAQFPVDACFCARHSLLHPFRPSKLLPFLKHTLWSRGRVCCLQTQFLLALGNCQSFCLQI